MSKIILGLSFYYHDSAAVILSDDKIIAAAQEERFTRKKFDSTFPKNAVAYCLNQAGIENNEIDAIGFYEDPVIKLDRLVETQLKYASISINRNRYRVNNWVVNKFDIEAEIVKNLPDFRGGLYYFPHHLSHAAAAFYPSPFEEAAIITVDGIGEWASTSYGIGQGNDIKLIEEQRFPHSIGLLYSTFTQYCGFKVDSGEYKLMGLAPYGVPKYKDLICNNIVQINNDGSIILDTNFFDYMTGAKMYTSNFTNLFSSPARPPDGEITNFFMDVAASIQSVTEDILIKAVGYVVEKTGQKKLTMAGGVALNCVANGKIIQSGIVDEVWIQPAAGDAGGALGAALATYYNVYDGNRKADEIHDKQQYSQLGPKYSDLEIQQLLDGYGFKYTLLSDSELIDKVGQFLAEGKVCANFSGRMEFGPRALGNRSILGDPRSSEMQKNMNLKIKFRESFRPFAPVVKEDKADEWFQLNGNKSPYMLLTSGVCNKKRIDDVYDANKKGLELLGVKRTEIPAVTHVNYSARVQTVSQKSNTRLYNLIDSFEQKTGVPLLINTSFNVRGEPIVCTPFDALQCFMNTNIDVLALENFILVKSEQEDLLKDDGFITKFDKD